MLKRIHLKNFMSHKDTELKLAPGINVLIGPNNCGKSAVVSALECLAYNPPAEFVLRHGSKECQVTVETDSGDSITWKRRKNSSVYVVNGETIQRIPRNTSPESVEKLLKLSKVASVNENDQPFDVHIARQKEPIFLLDKPGSQAAQFFASSSDAAKLIEMRRRHEQRTRDSNRDVKRVKQELHDVEAQLMVLEPIPRLQAAIQQAQKQHRALQLQQQQIVHLTDLLNNLRQHQQQHLVVQKTVRTLAVLTTPPLLHNIVALQKQQFELEAAQQYLQQTTVKTQVLRPLQACPRLANSETLEQLIADLARRHKATVFYRCLRTTYRQLKPLPALAPAVSLTTLLQSYRAETQRIAYFQHFATVLKPLKIASPLQDEKRLAQHITGLKQQQRKQHKVKALQTALEVLQKPQALAQPEQLAAVLKEMQDKTAFFQFKQKSLQCLHAVSTPLAVTAPQDLEALLTCLQARQTEVEQLQQKLERLRQQEAVAQSHRQRRFLLRHGVPLFIAIVLAIVGYFQITPQQETKEPMPVSVQTPAVTQEIDKEKTALILTQPSQKKQSVECEKLKKELASCLAQAEDGVHE